MSNSSVKAAVVISVAALGISALTYWYIQSEAEKAAKEEAQAAVALATSISSEAKAAKAAKAKKKQPATQCPVIKKPPAASAESGECDKETFISVMTEIHRELELVLLQIIQMAQMQQMQAAQMGRPVGEQQINQIIMTQIQEGLQQTTDKVACSLLSSTYSILNSCG